MEKAAARLDISRNLIIRIIVASVLCIGSIEGLSLLAKASLKMAHTYGRTANPLSSAE